MYFCHMFIMRVFDEQWFCRLIVSVHTYVVPVVSPRAELHEAGLFVEREVFYVDLTKRLVDGRRFPYNFARVV